MILSMYKIRKSSRYSKNNLNIAFTKDTQCMSNAITDMLPLEFAIWADESCFWPLVWVNRDMMITSPNV